MIDIHSAYTYAQRMPDISDRPKRKSMFLSPDALANLETTASRRHTERAAMEEALALLAEHDARMDALADFVEWATNEWGVPSPDDKARADEIWSNR